MLKLINVYYNPSTKETEYYFGETFFETVIVYAKRKRFARADFKASKARLRVQFKADKVQPHLQYVTHMLNYPSSKPETTVWDPATEQPNASVAACPEFHVAMQHYTQFITELPTMSPAIPEHLAIVNKLRTAFNI